MNPTKTCLRCGESKPVTDFTKDKSRNDNKCAYCKECNKKHYQDYREKISKRRKKQYENGGREKQGRKSMYKDKSCPLYLGIVIGERLCRHLFKDVEIMPHGNTGFDIICNKGKKIDVKTSCTRLNHGKNLCWKFNIDRNNVADFFILIAFDNRIDFNLLHMWMIPGKEINHRTSKTISLSTIHKWDKCKRSIEDAQLCCTELKNNK